MSPSHTVSAKRTNLPVSRLKDPGSAITHGVAFGLTLIAAVFLLYRSVTVATPLHTLCFSLFLLSMATLYAASTLYHSLDLGPRKNKILRKLDHAMIFVLIAGTYTPICVLALHDFIGYLMLGLVWGIALVGIVLKLCWIGCPKWFSSVLYIAMGWTCVIGFGQILEALPTGAFRWLLIGGLLYTVGGVIYALKLRVFNDLHPHFGSHEIFHLFVMAGSFCHFIVMYHYIVFL